MGEPAVFDIMMDICRHKGDASAGNRADAADHIGSMATELAQLARRHGFDALGYLLDMARLEAETLTRGPGRAGEVN
jgi:hypothetical protein